jgi:hypothetical protein
VSTALQLIETQIYEFELRSLSAAAALFPNLRSLRTQRLIDELRMRRHRTLLLVKAGSGSIVLSGLVWVAGIWLLNQTVVESLKEAWKRAPLHQSLVEFLARERPRRLRELKENITDELDRTSRQLSIEGVLFSYTVRTDLKTNRVKVVLSYHPRGRSRNAGPSQSKALGVPRHRKRQSRNMELNDI